MSYRVRGVITRTINRFEAAVESRASEGAIPWESEEQCKLHMEIELEYLRARKALMRLCQKGLEGNG